jgi:uncharacterized membrane protein YesL
MKDDIKHAIKMIGRAFSLWWGDWVNQVMVSLVAVICSVTIVLAPAALLGIFQEADDLVKGTRTGIAGWWKGFKSNFARSLLWGFVSLFVFAILGANIWFYYTLDTSWSPLLVGVFSILVLAWYQVQFYALGYLFNQNEKNLRLAWKNSFLTILGAPFFNFVIGLFILLMSILSLGLILPLMVGTPALLSILSILAVRDRLEVYGKLNPNIDDE